MRKLIVLTVITGANFAVYVPKAIAQEATHHEILAADGDVLGHSERKVRSRTDDGHDIVIRRE